MFWMFGMVVDNFLELEFVIVDGCIVVVNDQMIYIMYFNGSVIILDDIDIFWVFKGGGGGMFGIVIKFMYKFYYFVF